MNLWLLYSFSNAFYIVIICYIYMYLNYSFDVYNINYLYHYILCYRPEIST